MFNKIEFSNYKFFHLKQDFSITNLNYNTTTLFWKYNNTILKNVNYVS